MMKNCSSVFFPEITIEYSTAFLHLFCRRDVLDVVVHEIEVLSEPGAAAGAEAAAGLGAGASLAPAGAAHTASPPPLTHPPLGRQPGRGRGAPYLELPPAVRQGVVLIESEGGLVELEHALFGAGRAWSGKAAGSGGDCGTGSAGEHMQ